MATSDALAKTYRYPQVRLRLFERQLLLVSLDLLLLALSCGIGFLHWVLWAGRAIDRQLLQEQISWVVILIMSWVLWLTVSDAYNVRTAANMRAIVGRVLTGTVLLAAMYLVLFFVLFPAGVTRVRPHWLPDVLLPRAAPFLALLYSTMLLLGWRTTYTKWLTGSLLRRRVLIVGAGKAGMQINTVLKSDHQAHYTVVGFIDDDPTKHNSSINDTFVLGNRYELLQLCRSLSIDEIIIAISEQLDGALFQTLMDCYQQGIKITPMPVLYEQLTGQVAVEHIGSQWYAALPLNDAPMTRMYHLIKRGFDLLVGLLGLVALIIILPWIALIIRLDSPGPIFYKQQRAGKGGRLFWVYKFRSMIENAEQQGQVQWAARGDSRITRVGRLLRKMRIDELPQLLNILKGDMSIVGPRPERPEFIERLQQEIPLFRTRLGVKPGLTGWAQVNYGYGNTVEDALIKLKYDLYYIKNQSILLDVLIILRTLGVVAAMKGQ